MDDAPGCQCAFRFFHNQILAEKIRPQRLPLAWLAAPLE